MAPIVPNKEKKKSLFTLSELRIIAISLGVLSLGIALAWIGFILFVQK